MTLFVICVAVYLLSHFYHGIGITIGYHRLLSHRAFKCPLWVEYLFVFAAYTAFEGSPLQWVATHRVHHRYTDRDGDPHKPADGFWHSFAGWLYQPLVVLSPERVEQVCPDLGRDWLYRALDCNHTNWHALLCLIVCIAVRVPIYLACGPWILLAQVLGAFTAFLAPFWVNSVCHIARFGYRNFDIEDDSRNVWWVGIVAAGEGWHNNHHAVPQSARHGLRPDEIDVSWWIISLLNALGLASNIRLPKEQQLAEVYADSPKLDRKRLEMLARVNATLDEELHPAEKV